MSPFIAVAFAVTVAQSPSPSRKHPSRVAAQAGRTTTVQSLDLYSIRARRRLASLLRLKLLEMRKAGLERVTRAIERELARPPVVLP